MTTGEAFMELVLIDQLMNDRQSHDRVRAAPHAVFFCQRSPQTYADK